MTAETALTLAPEQRDEILSKILQTGDISCLSATDQWRYTAAICAHLGIDPLTRPFIILKTGGKTSLYATKNCGEQLINKHRIDVRPSKPILNSDLGLIECSAIARVPDINFTDDFRTSEANAYVPAEVYVPDPANKNQTKLVPIRGADLCNALMKCETKAVQRAVLRLIGLGMPSETELDTMTDVVTGEVLQPREQIAGGVNGELAERGAILSMDQRKACIKLFRDHAEQWEAEIQEELLAIDEEITREQLMRKIGANILHRICLVVHPDNAQQAIDECLEACFLDQEETARRRKAAADKKEEQARKKQQEAEEQARLKESLKNVKNHKTAAQETIASTTTTAPVSSAVAVDTTAVTSEVKTESAPKDPIVPTPTTGAASHPPAEDTPSTATLTAASTDEPYTPKRGEPINYLAKVRLDQALEEITKKRAEKWTDGKSPLYPNPNYEELRPVFKSVSVAAGWPSAKTIDCLKYKHKINAVNTKDPDKFTWDVVVSALKYLASHDHTAYVMKEDEVEP